MKYTDINRLRDIAEEAKKNAYEKYLPQYQDFYEHFLYPMMIKEAEKGNFNIYLQVTNEITEYRFAYELWRGSIPHNKYSSEHLRRFLGEKGYTLKSQEENNKTYLVISW